MLNRMFVTLLFVAGCGNISPGTDGGAHDLTADNPRNPNGAGPAAVDVGESVDVSAPGSYVLLGKSGISNVTGSSIVGGNLGLSPAAATFITGFALVADPSNVYSTSVSVVAPGKIFAADFASPTPSNLTTAVLAMQTAYTDADGRSPPDHLNLSSGALGGLTLAPGLYTFGSTVTIATDVTISGGANDVWIFQISNDLDLSTAKNVILAGGAQAKNVFWQVAGQVTIHAGAHFEGIILCQTAVTLQTKASLHGRAFAQTMIALDDNAVTAPYRARATIDDLGIRRIRGTSGCGRRSLCAGGRGRRRRGASPGARLRGGAGSLRSTPSRARRRPAGWESCGWRRFAPSC